MKEIKQPYIDTEDDNNILRNSNLSHFSNDIIYDIAYNFIHDKTYSEKKMIKFINILEERMYHFLNISYSNPVNYFKGNSFVGRMKENPNMFSFTKNLIMMYFSTQAQCSDMHFKIGSFAPEALKRTIAVKNIRKSYEQSKDFDDIENITIPEEEIAKYILHNEGTPEFQKEIDEYVSSVKDFLYDTFSNPLSIYYIMDKQHIPVEFITRSDLQVLYQLIYKDSMQKGSSVGQVFSFTNIYNNELQNLAEYIIEQKHAKDILEKGSSVLDNQHILQALPEENDVLDLYNYTSRFLASIVYDLERLLCGFLSENHFLAYESQEVKNLYERQNEHLEMIETLQRENKVLKQKTDMIELFLEKKDEKTELKMQSLLEENELLLKQNHKLKDKYNKLKSQYVETMEILEMENEIDKNDITDFKEVDVNANYLFVIGDDATYKTNISEAFPNATFTETTNFNKNKTDMVIVMATHIDHSTYYGIKADCKNNNIPLIHCNNANVDLIKDTIWNAINNN